MGVFSIPGNIKQMHLPFVLDPNSTLNQFAENEAKHVTGRPQVFSFRNKSADQKSGASVGKINICPHSFSNMSDDISYKLLYDTNGSNASINLNTILNNIPGIQIREFLPDTRLDQALDFFGKLIPKVISLFKKDKKAADEEKKKNKNKDTEDDEGVLDDGIIDKITRTCTFAVKYLTGFTASNFYTDTFKSVKLQDSVKDNGNYTTYIYKFPYTMWYQLQSCTTTNLYELPCVVEGKTMYASDGNPGWPSAGISLTNTAITGIPLVGPMIKSLLGNVNVSFMPWWDAKTGNATPVKNVEVKFDLYNNTAENALFNFIFVNTLIPNAKWIQFNMFQHSPHLYDVKIEGYGRLYACSGAFEVTYDGVLRNMPDSWIDTYLKPRINTSCMNADSFAASIKKNNLIKIPDVYHVKMTFTSLLPDTFNNYLFMYSQNANIITDYANTNVYIKSQATNFLTDGINGMIDKVKKVWSGEMNDDGQIVKKPQQQTSQQQQTAQQTTQQQASQNQQNTQQQQQQK